MVIKVLGSGCTKCSKLMESAKKAAAELGLEATFEKVEDMMEIMGYGVMKTPALVVDEEVKFSGTVPSISELKKHLS